jgi:probable F420-dependent oxidoreductase
MFRPFRFGVVSVMARSQSEWIANVQKAEALGYSTWLVPDHLYTDIAPLTALGVAAGVTTTLRIGSLVFCNDFRHPALLAKEAATLDLLSNGRFEFGLGAGYLLADYTQIGLAFEPPGTRIARLTEALELMKRLFTEETVDFAGTYYTVTQLQGKPKPVQHPHPPIFLGASGKRLLSLGAKHADSLGIGFNPWKRERTEVTPEEIAQKVAWVREAAGERFAQLELGYTVFHLVLTDGKAEGPLPHSVHVLAGSVEKIVDEIVARRAQYGFSYVQVLEQQMEAFAPVVARLAGQ